MKPGDKVVHIGHVKPDEGCGSIESGNFKVVGLTPQVNTVYVIRAVIPCAYNRTGLALIGSTVIYLPANAESGWDSRQFRKLDEMKQEAALRQKQNEPLRTNPRPV